MVPIILTLSSSGNSTRTPGQVDARAGDLSDISGCGGGGGGLIPEGSETSEVDVVGQQSSGLYKKSSAGF